MASFGIEEPKEDNTLDPMEPVMSMKRGINSVPWHPGTMGPPFVYKVTLLGACGAGKSAVIRSLKAALLEAKAGRVLVTAHMGAASAPFGTSWAVILG